jgi:H+/Cl- antiporter ClcA
MGFLLYRFFPNARGSGVPQTKAAFSLAMDSSP